MKKFLFILAILLCCGCSAKYEIDFIDDTISDNLTVTYERNGETDSQINESFSESFYAIGRDAIYNFDNKSTNDNIIINFGYDYNVYNFGSANIPKSCFNIFKFITDDDKYYLFAQGAFKCSYYAYEYLDSLDIVIRTNHVVVENNADEVDGDEYIWHVDPNIDDFSLRFIVDQAVNKTNENGIFVKVLIGFTSIGIVCGIFIYIRYKKVNKI